MQLVRNFYIVLIIIGLASCSTSKKAVTEKEYNDRLLNAVAWYQHSGEMQALYFQGFNIARERVDMALKSMIMQPLAVVVDIDETMLDNSPYETEVIMKGEERNGWTGWTNKASAKALPGALEFANYARDNNVAVYYITNRDDTERKATLLNLKSLGFPFSDDEHLLTRSDTAYSSGNTSSKMGRRAKVAATHFIVVLIGDNLNDFSEMFEDRSVNDGKEAVEKNQEMFGRKFIILPNPMYGAWEWPLYDYNKKLDENGKANKLRGKLLH